MNDFSFSFIHWWYSNSWWDSQLTSRFAFDNSFNGFGIHGVFLFSLWFPWSHISSCLAGWRIVQCIPEMIHNVSGDCKHLWSDEIFIYLDKLISIFWGSVRLFILKNSHQRWSKLWLNRSFLFFFLLRYIQLLDWYSDAGCSFPSFSNLPIRFSLNWIFRILFLTMIIDVSL